MKEWKEYNIGEICDTISDTYDGNASNVVLINTSDVLEGKCLNHTSVPNKDLRGQFKKQFKKNDILYSEIRPANKRYAFIDFEPTDYIASTKLMVIRSNDKVLPKFLYYILQSKEMIETLQFLAESRSGTFPQITFSELAIQTILLPEVKEQNKIVNFLEALDSKIELNRRINGNLEQQAQALFKAWFVDFEPFKSGKFVDSELGKIPAGWKVVELGKVTTQEKEKVGIRSDVKVLSPVTTGKLMLSEEYFTKQVFSDSIAKYILVKPNSFAYNPARVNIGSMGRNTFMFDGCVSPVYVVFSCEKEYHYFFDMYRQLPSFKEEVIARSIGGVRQTLKYSDFALIRIAYPPQNIVLKFNDLYKRLLHAQDMYHTESENLTEIRDLLLPRLMSGEIKMQ